MNADDIIRHIAQGGIGSAPNRAEVIADAADQLADLDVDRADLDQLADDARCPRDVFAELVANLDAREVVSKLAATTSTRKRAARKSAPKKKG